jgi:PAS domain S-box-containing protein
MRSDDHSDAAARPTGTQTGVAGLRDPDAVVRPPERLDLDFVESSGDCVLLLAPDGRVRYVNAEGVRVFGRPAMSDLLNRALPELFDGKVRGAAEEAIAVARNGGRGRFQFSLRNQQGLTTWWDAVVTPMRNGRGDVTQLLASSRDITERRREEAFRAGQHCVLEMIANGSPLSIVLDSLVRLVESQLEGTCSVLLLDEDGVTMRHGAAPSLPPEYVRAIDGVSIGPKAGSCGTAIYTGKRVIVTDIDTDPLWEDCRTIARRFRLRACWSTPIFSHQRRVIGAFAIYYAEPREPGAADLRLIDTAADFARIAIDQQRAHQALRDSEARNTAILRAIPDWMFLTTVDGVFLDFHARDTTKFHVPPSEFMGRSVTTVLPPQIAAALTRAFQRVHASDGVEKVEYSLGQEGDERIYEACIVRCNGDQILSIVRDITERRQSEFQADVHRRELAHLNRVATLGELAGTLTHELSQPLAAVLTNAQVTRRLLDRTPLDLEELRSALDDIIRDNRRAASVIDRLRALLRNSETTQQPVSLSEVVREVLELAAGELMARRIRVSTDLPASIPTARGDRVQLQQVLLNLVLNACEAMSATPVPDRELSIRTGADGGSVWVTVSDRGSGIPEGQLERIFEPFVTLRPHGLGLGLAISRSIVAAHGGTIRAKHHAGAGATFHCRLPIGDPETSAR